MNRLRGAQGNPAFLVITGDHLSIFHSQKPLNICQFIYIKKGILLRFHRSQILNETKVYVCCFEVDIFSENNIRNCCKQAHIQQFHSNNKTSRKRLIYNESDLEHKKSYFHFTIGN